MWAAFLNFIGKLFLFLIFFIKIIIIFVEILTTLL